MNISTLAERALLVQLNRSMYQPYVHDPTATSQVEAANNVHAVGRFNKRLLKDCVRLAETNAAFNDLYQYVNRNTVPWLDDGVRMLPSALYFEFTSNVRELMLRCNTMADQLERDWDRLVQDDLARLGTLANVKDYPDSVSMRSKFSVSIKFFPIPTADDFRVTISEEDKVAMEKSISEAETNVSKHLLTELLTPIERMVAKLAVPAGEKGSIFRNTLVENLIEVTERARKLNINNDEDVREVVCHVESAISRFANNVDVLRESPVVRSETKRQMEDIMAKMGSLMAA